MKLCALAFLLAAVVYVQCDHTFLGTNVLRPLVYHHDVEYSSKVFRKRVENLYFALPAVPSNFGRSIQVRVLKWLMDIQCYRVTWLWRSDKVTPCRLEGEKVR